MGQAIRRRADSSRWPPILTDANPTNDAAATALLQVFTTQVAALTGNQLTPEDAAALIAVAQSVFGR